MRTILPYDAGLKEYARKLRNKSTIGEVVLWKRLKGKQMLGYDFHRQKPIDRYIVDFFCNELILAIDIDGSSHDSEPAMTKDVHRQKELEQFGVRFLRFSEAEVRNNTDTVIQSIRQWIENIRTNDHRQH